MNLFPSSTRISSIHRSNALRSSRFFVVRSILPFPPSKAKYYKELEAAVNVVERACHLCVDVKKSLLSADKRILEKDDQTPVTIADFGVQALISYELNRSFPSIPLVAEEDSTSLRSNAGSGEAGADSFIVDSLLSAVTDKVRTGDKPLTSEDVLDAIDRGGIGTFGFGAKPATYWVLDPIDGTRGFLKGSEALYVVGLALVVKGEIALGVMGCPNWKEDFLPNDELNSEGLEDKTAISNPGIIMVSHVGYGTWTKRLSDMPSNMVGIHDGWTRRIVDNSSLLHEALFCAPDSQAGKSLPLSNLFSSKTGADDIEDEQDVCILPTCCGSLCKYLTVASGRASAFILQPKPQAVIKAWDHAVGMICVQEAGGQVTDWTGSQIDLAADHVGRRIIFPSGGVLITNGNLHDQILQKIAAN